MTAPARMLKIFIDETDVWGETQMPLHEAIVRRLRQLEVSGATVQQGIMGFGSHMKVHRKRLFGISDDRPVIITVVESEEKLRQILPEIRGMVSEGLLTLQDVEVIP